jgi:hypothetical protein
METTLLSTHNLPDLTGEIVAPGQPEWDLARRAWNLAVDQRPALVALPADADDVREVMRYAIRAGLKVAPQGTGHNASASSRTGHSTRSSRRSGRVRRCCSASCATSAARWRACRRARARSRGSTASAIRRAVDPAERMVGNHPIPGT